MITFHLPLDSSISFHVLIANEMETFIAFFTNIPALFAFHSTMNLHNGLTDGSFEMGITLYTDEEMSTELTSNQTLHVNSPVFVKASMSLIDHSAHDFVIQVSQVDLLTCGSCEFFSCVRMVIKTLSIK